MPVHIHTMRKYCARALLLVPVTLLLGWASAAGSKNLELAEVSGRVTCADQPFSGLIYFLPEHVSGPISIGAVNPDGSFELHVHGRLNRRGAVPGTYRVLIRPRVSDKTGSRLDKKYQDPRTTDLLVNVGPNWNYLRLNLN
jgi:hypothetical protein